MKKTSYIFLLFLFSCTTIQQAVIKDKTVMIRTEKFGEVIDGDNSYTAEVIHKSSEYEFYVTYQGVSVYRYLLPPNKLQLLYEMEKAFKDILTTSTINYYMVTVTSSRTIHKYKVNTDLVANFITGLKKR